MATVFVSYTHGDEDLKKRLLAHLTPLQREGLINVWHDRLLLPGEAFDAAIKAKLAQSDVILLLISAEFIGSAYCYEEEMARAFERQRRGEARVVAVILRPCQWRNVPTGDGRKLDDFIALPREGKAVTSWANVDEALDDVAANLRRVLQGRASARSVSGAGAEGPPTPEPVRAPADSTRTALPRLKLEPTDQERDQFLRQGFARAVEIFEQRLSELQAGDGRVTAELERVDSRCFIARAYLTGRSIGGVQIFYGGDFMGRSLCLSFDVHSGRNSMNDWLSVEADREGLYFKASAMSHYRSDATARLDAHGAAEYLWDTFVRHIEARAR